MSAIGINISDRDAVNGWESLRPRPLNRFVADYKQACYAVDEAWSWYYEMCDQLEYVKTRFPDDEVGHAHFSGLLNDALHVAEAAEKAKEQAWKELNCQHVIVDTNRDNGVCETCGARF